MVVSKRALGSSRVGIVRYRHLQGLLGVFLHQVELLLLFLFEAELALVEQFVLLIALAIYLVGQQRSVALAALLPFLEGYEIGIA